MGTFYVFRYILSLDYITPLKTPPNSLKMRVLPKAALRAFFQNEKDLTT